MKKIIHLVNPGTWLSDTLCWHDFELINKKWEKLEIDRSIDVSYDELIIRKKWNTNCKDCQEVVSDILSQIKRGTKSYKNINDGIE
jgi:hypothetical protein